MNQRIAILFYSQVEFVWVSDHWDHHLNGLCRYNNKLCEFQWSYFHEKVKIYKLGFFSKIKWLIRKKLFEWMVGYHWTYKNGTRNAKFGYRKPYWFFKILFNLYYTPYKIRRYLKKAYGRIK